MKKSAGLALTFSALSLSSDPAYAVQIDLVYAEAQ